MYDEGRALLGEGAQYRRTLFLARLGNASLLLAAARGVRAVGRSHRRRRRARRWRRSSRRRTRTCSRTPASPAPISRPRRSSRRRCIAWMRWREEPTAVRAVLLGVAMGLGATTKFSALAFLGLALALGEAVRWLSLRRANDARARSRAMAVGDRCAGRRDVVDVGGVSVSRRADRARRRAGARAGVLRRSARLLHARQRRPPRLPARRGPAARLVVLLSRRARGEDTAAAARAGDRRRRISGPSASHRGMDGARSASSASSRCWCRRSCRASISAYASCSPSIPSSRCWPRAARRRRGDRRGRAGRSSRAARAVAILVAGTIVTSATHVARLPRVLQSRRGCASRARAGGQQSRLGTGSLPSRRHRARARDRLDPRPLLRFVAALLRRPHQCTTSRARRADDRLGRGERDLPRRRLVGHVARAGWRAARRWRASARRCGSITSRRTASDRSADALEVPAPCHSKAAHPRPALPLSRHPRHPREPREQRVLARHDAAE